MSTKVILTFPKNEASKAEGPVSVDLLELLNKGRIESGKAYFEGPQGTVIASIGNYSAAIVEQAEALAVEATVPTEPATAKPAQGSDAERVKKEEKPKAEGLKVFQEAKKRAKELGITVPKGTDAAGIAKLIADKEAELAGKN